jgi:uncharacterized protein YprB with RNaseH-like and TPR domain
VRENIITINLGKEALVMGSRRPFKTLSFKLPVKMLRGTLIDIETTGRDVSMDEIITLGYVSGDRLIIIQRTSESPQHFYSHISSVIRGLNRPFYAYNMQFEKKFLSKKLHIELRGEDLFRPVKGLAEKRSEKWPKLDELIIVSKKYLGLERIPSKKVPWLWKKYLREGKEEYLGKIIGHNLSDLLKSLWLLIYYNSVGVFRLRRG